MSNVGRVLRWPHEDTCWAVEVEAWTIWLTHEEETRWRLTGEL